MSTQAPSPAAAPAGNTPAAEPTPSQPKQEGTPENPGIRIKPIPPRRDRITFKREELPTVSPDGEAIPEGYKPRLPGVVDNDTGADEIPQLSKQRDPATGRFVKGGEGRPELPKGQETVEEGVPPKDKPEMPEGQEPPKQGKVKFLGKEYDSLAVVEQVHRTLQGEHRKLLDERRKLQEEVEYGYGAGHAWKAEYEKAMAELQQYRNGGRPAPAQGQPTGGTGQIPESGVDFDVDAIVGSMDMGAFEMIAAHPRGGLPQAGKYLVAETLAAVKDKLVPMLLAQMDKRLQPVEAETTTRAAQASQLQAFELVAGMQTVDGAPAFPELGDEAALEEMGELWGRMKRRSFQSAQDIIEGVALYRLMKGMSRQPAQTVEVGGTTEPTPAPVAAASLEMDPAGTMPPNGGRAQGSPEARRLIAALDKVDLVDPVLGFRRNT